MGTKQREASAPPSPQDFRRMAHRSLRAAFKAIETAMANSEAARERGDDYLADFWLNVAATWLRINDKVKAERDAKRTPQQRLLLEFVRRHHSRAAQHKRACRERTAGASVTQTRRTSTRTREVRFTPRASSSRSSGDDGDCGSSDSDSPAGRAKPRHSSSRTSARRAASC